MPKPVLAFVLVTALLALPVGCSRKPDDETVAKDIQQKLAADPDTKDANITVASKNGQVTLNGQATSPAARPKAEQIAKAEPGVSNVDDEIAVQQAGAPPAAETAAAAAPAPAQAPPPPPAEKPKPQPVVIPAGTVLDVKLTQPLSSKTAQAGDPFTATLADPIVAHGKTVIPAGANVTGKVVDAKSKGKFKGEARLELAATSISVHGKTYPIQASMQGLTEKGKGKRTAATTGGGAAGGALIGGLAGGGKGAGIGALLGAGVGLAGGAFTGNKQIELPAESQLAFKLTAPLTLTSRSPAAAEGDQTE
jgi:BON domain-containing protein